MYYKVMLTFLLAAAMNAPAFGLEATPAIAEKPSAPAVVEDKEATKAELKEVKQEAKEAKAQAKEAAKVTKQAAKKPIGKAEQEKLDAETIKASNQIDGQKVNPKIMKDTEKKKGFSLGDLNPVKWIFKPIIDIQKRVVELQKQIVRLEAPIANLQKPMVGLRSDMVGVGDKMGEVREQLAVMHTDINNIHGGMKGVDGRLAHMEEQLSQMYDPIVKLKDPVVALRDPVLGVGNQLTTLKSDLKELKDVVSFTTISILVAVLVVGILIVLGTPIAALFAWRHRRWIMQKFGNEDVSGKAEPTDETPEEAEAANAKQKEAGPVSSRR